MTPLAQPRRRRIRRGHVNHDRWLVSYADFITLLFAFFTTMYAVSTVDAQKMSKMVTSMQTAFAVTDQPFSTRSSGAVPDASGAGPRSSADAEADLARALQERLGGSLVSVTVDRRGVVVSVTESGSFPTGSADLAPAARDILSQVALAIRESPHAVRVEGHTDDVPIRSSRFSSNWELSTARATAVVDFLIQAGGLAPERLSAAGYGEYRSRVLNDSETNRALNRRVDIVILNEETTRQEEPQRTSRPDAPLI
jgi:chemotaxis protein MotB